ncbi:MAG TPA: hypothetical protein PLL10_09465, partial [Elusimicrobiales bacterium]|nr:hypothetical protein [Elusimicrobiales bacterium]
AVSLAPKDSKLYNFRANLHIMMGNYTPALRDTAALLLLDDNDAHGYEMLGGLLLAHKKPAEALWALHKSLELSPGNKRLKELLQDKKFNKVSPAQPDLKALSETKD